MPREISEKSELRQGGSCILSFPETLTLSVHEVGDGHRVAAHGFGHHALPNGIGVRLPRAGAHVLLTQLLDLDLDRDGILQDV